MIKIRIQSIHKDVRGISIIKKETVIEFTNKLREAEEPYMMDGIIGLVNEMKDKFDTIMDKKE